MRNPKQRFAVITLAVAVSLGGASIARAQQVAVELTPFAGYYIAADIYSTNGTVVGLANDIAYGGRLTFTTNQSFGLEFAYTRTQSNATLKRVLAGQPNDQVGKVGIDNYDINFLALQRSNNPHVLPFVEIGFGWAATHPTINTDFVQGVQPQGHTNFNFNFGLGTKIQMSKAVALRLEGRWRVMSTNITTSGGLWCDPWGYCYQYASNWYDSGELNGGLSIRLK
ncbi:MAG TPA: outer membrane beta-barrel protein [Gemmatimonadales bacterium]|nr:outer membrane beta-barrel protein [Gemmatimonadales bacterium]